MIAQFYSTKSPDIWINGSKHKYILQKHPYAYLNVVYHEDNCLYEYIYK